MLIASFLLLVNLSRSLNRIRILWRLVGSQTDNSRKAQRIAAFVAVRAHHIIESNLKNNFRFNDQAEALVLDLVLQKPLGHFGDLGVGEAGVSFPNILQPVSIPHCESVVTQNSDAL